MNVNEEQICRLCLTVTEKEFQLIDDVTRHMFEVVMLKVNLDIIKDPVVCNDCTEILKICFTFKSACVDTEEIISSFAADNNEATLQMQRVFKNKDVVNVGDNFVCRFCSMYSIGSNYVLLDTLMNDDTFAEMLQALLPETDFDIIENSVICLRCAQDLEYYINFVKNCLDVENKIMEYCQKRGARSSAQVKLSQILQFSFKNIVETDHAKMRAIKQEPLEDNCEIIKSEEAIDIKEEEVNFNETACETWADELNTSCESKPAMEPTQTTPNREHCMCDKIHLITVPFLVETSTDNVLAREKFNCPTCGYQTKRNFDLKSHMLIHRNITEVNNYECSVCAFKTKRKSGLKSHMLRHKDATQVEIYECSMCTYETKRKSALKIHTLVHNDIARAEMYKCPMCNFQTKRKFGLKKHLLIHSDISEVKTYKCSKCAFVARGKCNLEYHMLKHKDVTEVEMYKCSMCTYETRHKGNLRKHTVIHKNVAEVEMYKCSMCTYETRYKGNLRKHMLIHGNITGGKMYER